MGATAGICKSQAQIKLTMTPDQFATFIRTEMAKWAKVVKDSGAKFE